MSRMLAGHEHTARWGTDSAAAVGAVEFHSLRRKPVDVGREAVFATIGRYVADARVIEEDENDVGFLIRLRRRFSGWGCGWQQSEDGRKK